MTSSLIEARIAARIATREEWRALNRHRRCGDHTSEVMLACVVFCAAYGQAVRSLARHLAPMIEMYARSSRQEEVGRPMATVPEGHRDAGQAFVDKAKIDAEPKPKPKPSSSSS